MAYFVLVAWLIQATVGVTLFADWLRQAHGRGARTVVAHVLPIVSGLALWVWFVATGALVMAWLAFAILTFGLTFGDAMLIARNRRRTGVTTTLWREYGSLIAALIRGQLPPRVVFHAWFSPVIWFPCLGVCIAASIAAG